MIPTPYDNRGAIGRGQLHLAFEIAGKRIAYAYIRKNASSACVVEGGRSAASAASDEANHEEVRGNASV